MTNFGWGPAFFTVNLFLQLLAIDPIFVGFLCLFSLSAHRQNDCSTRIYLEKRKQTVAIIREKKK